MQTLKGGEYAHSPNRDSGRQRCGKKRKMAEEVTDAISRNLECPREAVTIVIREIAKEHLARAGKLACDEEIKR
jgi:4-oxalocrotonate tautomerase